MSLGDESLSASKDSLSKDINVLIHPKNYGDDDQVTDILSEMVFHLTKLAIDSDKIAAGKEDDVEGISEGEKTKAKGLISTHIKVTKSEDGPQKLQNAIEEQTFSESAIISLNGYSINFVAQRTPFTKSIDSMSNLSNF